jgi:hypothetical protein
LAGIDGAAGEEDWGDDWGLGLEDLEGALPFLAAIGADEIEVKPTGGESATEV